MTRMLRIEPSDLQAGFSRAPFRVGHDLADHPLLQLDRIGDLADALPADHVEHNLGAVPDVLPGGEAPRLDATPGEIARGIHDNGCWMVAEDHRERPGVQRAAERAARRGRPARRRTPRARSTPARGLHLPVGAQLDHARPRRSRAQLPAADPGVQDDGRRPLPGRAQRAARARAPLRRRPPQHGRDVRRPAGRSCSSRATASTCPCTRRTWCATARRPRSRCRSRGAPQATERAEKAHVANARLRRLGLSPAMPGPPPRRRPRQGAGGALGAGHPAAGRLPPLVGGNGRRSGRLASRARLAGRCLGRARRRRRPAVLRARVDARVARPRRGRRRRAAGDRGARGR